MADVKKRFTVRWTARGQAKRSALMTEQEANRFAGRLRDEKVEALQIHEAAQDPARAARRG